MKLRNVAKAFDKLVFADAYHPTTTFKGQFDAQQNPTRDSLTDMRQVLSAAPEAAIPARRTVQTPDGFVWLVGDEIRDYFRAEHIRSNYVVHQASELAAVKTLSETILASAGHAAYASRIWVKGSKQIEADSQIVNVYDIYFAQGEPLAEGTLVYLSDRWHLIRSLYPSAAGMLVAMVDELPEPVWVSAALTSRKYVPETDEQITASALVGALRIHWQSHFRYLSAASEKFKPGDTVLIIRKADATVRVGDIVEVVGNSYRVDDVVDDGLVWAAHLCHV